MKKYQCLECFFSTDNFLALVWHAQHEKHDWDNIAENTRRYIPTLRYINRLYPIIPRWRMKAYYRSLCEDLK